MRFVRRLLLLPLLAAALTLPAAARSLTPALEAEIDKIFEPWTKPRISLPRILGSFPGTPPRQKEQT